MKNFTITQAKFTLRSKLQGGLTALMVLIIVNIFAQSPQAFKYQAVVRDAAGDIISNQLVSVRAGILQGSSSGTIVYSETHSPTTNEFGLINLEIGNGSVVSGDFTTINWGGDDYFLQIELDEIGGSNYQLMGTSQILSVPYSLYSNYSKTADSLVFPFRQHYSSSYLPAIDIRYMGDDCGAIEGHNSYYNTFGSLANSFGGVYGENFSNSNTGILGTETAGVSGYSANGFAGIFSGKTYFEGNVGIYSSNPQDHLTIFRHYDDVNVGFYSDNNATTNLKFSNELETITWNLTKRSMAENNKLQFRLSTGIKQEKILMTMTTEGKVGVGTTDPVTALHVMDQMNGESNIKIQAPLIPPFEPGIIFSTTIDMWRIYRDGSTNNLTFRNLKDFGYGIEDRLAISSDGNVGINTICPQANLHVNDLMMMEPRNSAPVSPQEGMIYYDSNLHKLKVFDGTGWQDCF
ncbi:MAG: hypothetical protein K8S16_09425 [Bacteroidales bacterium]|nr:hypothetical protein [Bacteroidales bacterium]